MAEFKVGDKVRVIVPNYPDSGVEGEIQRIANYAAAPYKVTNGHWHIAEHLQLVDTAAPLEAETKANVIAEIVKDIEAIRQIDNLDVVQINLDWIEQQLNGKTPVAIGLLIGEFQALFEEIADALRSAGGTE